MFSFGFGYNAVRKDVMNMAKFIPKAKMSKKAQKKLAKKNRVTWEVNPVTRKTENRKVYNRKRELPARGSTNHRREFSYAVLL